MLHTTIRPGTGLRLVKSQQGITTIPRIVVCGTSIRQGTRFKVSEVTTGDQNDATHYYSSRYKFKVSEVTTGDQNYTTHYYSARYNFKVSEVTTGDQNDATHYYSSRYKVYG